MTKRIHLTLPDWMKKEMKSDDPDRIRELITKGIMYENEKLLIRNYNKDDKAFSETWSRDSVRGLAGFPESVL
jgi:hypothetical protein